MVPLNRAQVASVCRVGCGVKLLSSIVEVPFQLIMAFSLALSPASGEASRAHALASEVYEASTKAGRVAELDPYRFSEQIWLRALSERRDEPRFSGFCRRIFSTSAGRFYVPVPSERRELLALRRDPVVAGYVAERFAADNASRILEATGRAASAGELYIAHLIGPELAVRMIRALDDRGTEPLLRVVPDAASKLEDGPIRYPSLVSLAEAYVALVGAIDRDDVRARELSQRLVGLRLARGARGGGAARRTNSRHGPQSATLAGLDWAVTISRPGVAGARSAAQ